MEKMLRIILEFLESVGKGGKLEGNIAATAFFNEGWLLRLALKWFAEHEAAPGCAISFRKGAHWYAEAPLRTRFNPQTRGDTLAEGYTHADAVYGDFEIGAEHYVTLTPACRQFVAVEAKLYSPFSAGVTHAEFYNQAARTIACMCETVTHDKPTVESIGTGNTRFLTLLPASQIAEVVTFKEYTGKDHIKNTVRERVEQYKDRPGEEYTEKLRWYERDFLRFLDKMEIALVTWEEVIEYIKRNDPDYGAGLEEFYEKCKEFGRPPKSA